MFTAIIILSSLPSNLCDVETEWSREEKVICRSPNNLGIEGFLRVFS